MNNNPSNATTTQTAPSWELPYQQNAVNQSQAQYNSVNNPTQLVAPFSTQQNQAISGITNLATNGTQAGNAANGYVSNVLNGQPANNPYLDSEFQLGANQVRNQLQSEFANSGSNVENSLPVQADQLNNLATQLYGGAYNTGIQQQEQAASLAPALTQNDYNAQQSLFNAGGAVQGLAQQYITAPQQFLQQYLNQTMQAPGATTTMPYYTNNGASAAGGALLGGQIGNSLGGSGGYGGLIGSLAGGLLGGLA